MTIAVNLGCGLKPVDVEGYEKTVNVDLRPEVKPDLLADVNALPFEPGTVGCFYSAHFLEHFSPTEGRQILRKLHALLAPGGKLWIVVPNLEFAAVQILRDGFPNPVSCDILYGHQDYATNFHKQGFTPRSLRRYVEALGNWTVLECKARNQNFEVELKAEKKS